MPDPAKPSSLGTLFYETVARYPQKKALFYKTTQGYQSHTWDDTAKKVRSLASFWNSQGVRKGDRVAILSENRPEWLIADIAALSLGIVTVPIYTSLSIPEIQYLLEDAGCVWAAVSDKTLFQKVAAIQPKPPLLRGILVFDKAVLASSNEIPIPVHALQTACQTPADNLKTDGVVAPSDLASIIYTSGTTAKPKGVMLTHGNFIDNVLLCREALRMGPGDTHLSFLPLSHVFERTTGHYLMICIGATIAYAENLDTTPANIIEIRPTFLLGVPRFYEKIQTRTMDVIRKASPTKQKLFAWAKELGRKKRMGIRESFLDPLWRWIADILVIQKFKARLGGRLRFCFSGGAPLPKEIAEFFCDLGVMIYEGYGLTETSPVMSFNREKQVRFGSVGIPLRSVEVRIAEDGEIVTRSSCVMKGYFGKPAETAEVLKDGWFYTGDLGRIDSDGFLYITGRKKELIVTSGGKKVSPRPIEEMVERDDYVQRCVLFGEGKKFISALIVPKKEALLDHAKDEKIAFSSYGELLQSKKILNFLDSRIHALMQTLASYEQIKYFVLLENDFTQSAGELTPTLKVKRSVVYDHYKDRLLPFYDLNRG